MSITVNLWLVLALVAWLLVGGAVAWRMATSPTAIIVLMLAWPIVLVLWVLSPFINYYANREFRR